MARRRMELRWTPALDGEDGEFLWGLLNQIACQEFPVDPFDDGWCDGWCGYRPKNPHADGSPEESEWRRGFWMGRNERRNESS
jgi:hypothetical protein